MGNPIEPTDDEWEGCPDCCVNLPEILDARVDLEPWGTFEGQISRMPLMECSFWGGLWLDSQFGSLLVTFCSDDAGKVAVGFWPPAGDPRYGNKLDQHCYPNFELDGDDDMHVAVWHE